LTYCVGILLNEGLVLASDSRTNAGIDRVSTFRKMHVLEKRGERFFALLTAGNLSLTQGVMSLLREWLESGDPEKDLWAVGSMFAAARAVGTAIREMHKIDGGYLQQHDVDFSASFILAGQLKTGQLRLFLIYDAGNFIEAMGDTIYFQIGEVKYGKADPRPHHPAEHRPQRRGEMRADLLRFDHALQRVGWAAHRHLRLPARLHGSRLHHQARRVRPLSSVDPRRLGIGSAQGLPGHRAGAGLEDLIFGVRGNCKNLQQGRNVLQQTWARRCLPQWPSPRSRYRLRPKCQATGRGGASSPPCHIMVKTAQSCVEFAFQVPSLASYLRRGTESPQGKGHQTTRLIGAGRRSWPSRSKEGWRCDSSFRSSLQRS
jgi:hypothetical protein